MGKYDFYALSGKIEHADRIIEGAVDGESEKYADYEQSPLAYLFVELLKNQNRRVYPINKARLNEVDNEITYLAESQGVFAGYMTLEDGWYLHESDDFIGFYKDSGEPVLVTRRGGRFYYENPYLQQSSRVDGQNEGLIRNEGVFIFASKDEGEFREVVFKAVYRCRREILMYLLLSLISIPLAGAVIFIADISNGARMGNGLRDFLPSLFLTASAIISMILVNMVENRLNYRITVRIRSFIFPAVMGHLLSLKSGTVKGISRELVSTFILFVESVEKVITNVLSGLTYLIYVLIIAMALSAFSMEVRNPFLNLLSVYSVVVLIVIAILLHTTKRMSKNEAALSAVRKEMMDVIDAVKNSAAEDRFYTKFAIEYSRYINSRIEVNAISGQPAIIAAVVTSLGIFLLFYSLVTSDMNDVGAGQIITLMSLMGMLAGYMSGLFGTFFEIARNLPNLRFAQNVLSRKSEGGRDGHVASSLLGKIEFSHVSFSYSEHTGQVLRDISFTIEPGEYTAIVGPSGSGKSTLIRLLLGFEEPDEGDILFDDISIGQYDLRSLRGQISTVLQDEGIINGSIKANIGMTDDPDIEKVAAAARQASIADEIERWPMKYNTMLSCESSLISGGQKQRIILARALMNEPKILILDEATSAMDNITQDAIRRNLDRLGYTRITIAHRLSTVENCDRIFVLDKGTIVESGTFRELMDANGLFAELARRNLA